MIYFIYFDSLFSLFTCGNYPESPCVSESARLYIGSIYAIEIDINNGFSRKATMTQQTASRTTTFAFTNYLSRLPWLIAALGMVPATLAQLPSVVVGANVETSNVCPSCTHYIKTNRGDLFDLAKLAGWNTLRLTQFETWGPNEMDIPYTAQNWSDVFGRSLSTNMYLIVILEQSTPEQNAVASAPSGQAGTVRLSYDEQSIDNILGALPSAQRSKVAIDLGNEEDEDYALYSVLSIYQTEAQYIRNKYPGVLITVGGWKIGSSYNKASDGSVYESLEDFVSAHIYVDTSNKNSPASDTSSVLNYFSQVNQWSGGKPILMGEYGASSGVTPVSQTPPVPPPCTTCSPSAQAATNAASVAGVVEAQQQGINAIGGLVWSYYPRGALGEPAYNLSGSDNQLVVLVPDGVGGPNLPIAVLPSASVLCPAAMSCPAFPSSLVEAIFTGGYAHVVGDTNNGKHVSLDANFTWNPLSGNTVVSSSDLLSGINSGANLSCDFPFSDGTSAHVSAELLSVTVTATSTSGGMASGSELGYAHLTADTVNGKHFTADGHLTWNMLSGNTVTTASDLVSGFEPGGNISAVVTFEGGSSVHITAQFGAVTITQP
jgi:hypothetical protein